MDQKENDQSALNPTVLKLGLVSFFADVASEMLYPITPIFLTTILGASMSSVGLIEGLAEAIASLLKTYSGSWSDRISKRKPFVVGGYFLAAISKPLIGISTTWSHVLGARALDRVGKGIRTAPRDALLSESVDEKQLGAAFGWHRAMDTAGAAIGPLFAIALLSANAADFRPLYIWSVVPGLIAVCILLFVHEPKNLNRQNKKWENPLRAWPKLDAPLRRYLLSWAVFSLANSSDAFLLMKAKSSGISTIEIILIYCLYNLIYAFSSPIFGKLSDFKDRRTILVSGLFIFALVYVGFSMADQVWHFWVLFGTYGLYMGATDGVGKALTVDLAPAGLKATALGLLGTVTGVCTLFASVAAGFIWDHWGSRWTFIFGGVGALIAALLISVKLKKDY